MEKNSIRVWKKKIKGRAGGGGDEETRGSSEILLLEMLILKAAELARASAGLIKQHELVKPPSTCHQKPFNR